MIMLINKLDSVLGTGVTLRAGQLGTWYCSACKPPSSWP
jgi:hypothetical protein